MENTNLTMKIGIAIFILTFLFTTYYEIWFDITETLWKVIVTCGLTGIFIFILGTNMLKEKP